jgi:hypothetical protein
MSPARAAIAVAVLLAVAGVGYFFFWPWYAQSPTPQSSAPAVSAPPPAVTGPRYPLPAEVPRELPTLNESDAPLTEAIASLVGLDAFGRVLNPETLVRNLVATIDNLPRETVAQRLNPMKPVPSVSVTQGTGDTLAFAPANDSRYAMHVRLLESVDTAKLVAAYRHFYPLFQQAYVDLGYPNRYFNDRLVEVIDHLLETPEPKGPIRLVQPKVLLEFADPALEESSFGQKAMLRLGSGNRARVKAKLREIRAAVSATQ